MKQRHHHWPARVAILLIPAALCCLSAAPARAQDDDDLATRYAAYTKYLNKHGLPPGLCLEYSPGDLMARIAKRHDFSYGGTPGGEADTTEVFFQKYRAALQPALDADYPEAKAVRAPLSKLLDTIYDFMEADDHHRSYVTHERIAAYGEHLLAVLYADENSRPTPVAAQSHPTRDDVAVYARVKGLIMHDNAILPAPDYAAYGRDVQAQLEAVEKAAPSRNVSNIRMCILDFIDRYRDRVEWPILDEDTQPMGPQLTSADNDPTFETLFRKTPLTAAQCRHDPPDNALGVIADQNEGHGIGAPKYRKKVIDLFYSQYLEALRPEEDAFPKAKAMRAPLRTVLYSIFDFTDPVTRHPQTSITHPRIDAYAEYILSNNFSPEMDDPSNDDAPDPADSMKTDVVTFARLKAAIAAQNAGIRRLPDFDRYAQKLLARLTALEKAGSPVDPSFDILQFIDQYPDLLDPDEP